MTDEHTKGTITKTKGRVEETPGKVTGNKEQGLHGRVKQVQGEAQQALGDVQDTVRGDKEPALHPPELDRLEHVGWVAMLLTSIPAHDPPAPCSRVTMEGEGSGNR